MMIPKRKCKLVLFDVDGTLLNGRSIVTFAEKKGFTIQLTAILESKKQPYEKSLEIAQLLKGLDYDKLLEIFRQIPLQDEAALVIQTLQEKNIKTAIATDGYQCFADDLKQRLGLDFAYANKLVIKNGLITGDLLIHNQKKQPSNNGKIHSICKKTVAEHLCQLLNITAENIIAVGDGPVDIDMIRYAGVGIAYNAPVEVQAHADRTTNNLHTILEYI